MMKYDVILTDVGNDTLSVSLAVMNSIQQLAPIPFVDVSAVKHWFSHLPILLRRGIAGEEARAMEQRYRELGATVSVVPSQLYFPKNLPDISKWYNEWFSEHLIALHEQPFSTWAKGAEIEEGYRFSYLPSFGVDMTLRIWRQNAVLYASARRSIGRIGPLPGPPKAESIWVPTLEEWGLLQDALAEHRFWESESWETVPEGYIVLDEDHWILEGWREKRYHVLCDRTPNEGALHTVGLLLIELLPDTFVKTEAK